MAEKFHTFFKIPVWELLLNPNSINQHVQKISLVCEQCQKKISIRFFPDKITILCACGCGLFYYPNEKNNNYCFRYIPKEKYIKGFRKKEE